MAKMPSENLINEEFICVLKRNATSNKIDLDYLPIKQLLGRELNRFNQICFDKYASLDSIITYLQKDNGIEAMSGYYSYCKKLNDAYQGFTVSKAEVVSDIESRKQTILLNAKSSNDKLKKEEINSYKIYLYKQYEYWVKAFSIEAAYELCRSDKNILAFSHRKRGWSNPVHQLTPNFSVEIKTNFGYGSVSYFFSKLKFKNIEIIPFSEWFDYERGTFSEIVRYTRMHYPDNQSWKEAMSFCETACNLSLSDENQFVAMYIIGECEKMISGLEIVMNNERFEFKQRYQKPYSVNKSGRVLLEYRAEKVAGAIDFIVKILAFKDIINVNDTIKKIRDCNKSLQPILAKELPIIEKELTDFNSEMSIVKPKLALLQIENDDYNKSKERLKVEMTVNNKELNIEEFDKIFAKENPDYKEFLEVYVSTTRAHSVLLQQIFNTRRLRDSIKGYNDKIVSYFK